MSSFFDLSKLVTDVSDSYMSDGDVFSFLIIFFMIILVFVLIGFIVDGLSRCFIFKKANKPVWAAFVPIYNNVVECEVCGVNTIWVWVNLGLSFITGIVPFLSIVYLITYMYFKILTAISMSKSFGKDEGFGIATVFFRPICYLILGCGSSQYAGPMPMKDHIMEMFGVSENTTSHADTNQMSNVMPSVNEVKKCSSCGTPIKQGENFCSSCGNKI